MAKTLTELAVIGRTDLPPDHLDGRSVRDDGSDFFRLQHEIDQLGNPLSDQPVDWQTVVEAASTIIEEQSKDLLACSYLCRGLFEEEGYSGLATGLNILVDIVQYHWEVAYLPKRRVRGRGGEIQWLVDNLHSVLEQRPPEQNDGEAVRAISAAVDQLELELDERLGEHSPIFRTLRNPIRSHLKSLEAEAAEVQDAPQPSATPKRTPASAAPPSEQSTTYQSPPAAASNEVTPTASAAPHGPNISQVGSSETEIKTAVKATQGAINEIAAAWRAQKLSDPRPYAIVRFATWMNLAHSPQPPQIQDGKLILPGPSTNQLAELRQLQLAGEHAQLIEKAERLFGNPKAPANGFWLDGHRLVAQSLTALGGEFKTARETLVLAVRYYLERFPAAIEGAFNNDIPFADSETRLWLDNEVARTIGPDRDKDAAKQEADSSMAEAFDTAGQLATQGKTTEALRLLRDGARQATTQRQRFAWRLQQARLCIDLNLPDIAQALLEDLLSWADTYRLDEWEPTLSIEILRLLIQSHGKATLQQSNAGAEKLRIWQQRLSCLDPLTALSLTQNG